MPEVFPSAINDAALPTAIGAVSYRKRDVIEHEYDDLRAALDETGDGFADHVVTAPSPGIVATTIQNRHYDGERAYLAALGKASQMEYEAIVNRGFVLQLDCPGLAMERHLYFGDRPLSECLAFVENVVAALNDALADEPCLIAGVVERITNVVEHPEVVADRIQRIARVLGDPKRVLAGTDCGFDTAAGLGRAASDVVWAKLVSRAEGARLVSQRISRSRGHERIPCLCRRARPVRLGTAMRQEGPP